MSFDPLNDGDVIGVCAPSSFVERADIEDAVTALSAMGFSAHIHPQTYERYGQSAGTTAQKIEALHALYADPTIKAIWAAGGGNRALDIIDGLDFELIHANPKPLIGFSDITALLNAISARAGIVNIHGPVLKELHKHSDEDVSHLASLLRGEATDVPLSHCKALKTGTAEGMLIGGNLSLFHLLSGMEDCPPLEGAILCLEDCGDHLSRFDRMLMHMKRHSVFEKIGGLVIGEFSNMQDGARPFGFTLEDIILEHCPRDIPTLMAAPFGHGKQNMAFPIGAHATLTVGSDASQIHFKL